MKTTEGVNKPRKLDANHLCNLEVRSSLSKVGKNMVVCGISEVASAKITVA